MKKTLRRDELGLASRGAAGARASWVWVGNETQPRHQAVVLRRRVTLPTLRMATLCISADSRYRLLVNGHWVQDGPGRSYPEHHRYDQIDIGPWLHAGENVLLVRALYYGFATMQALPQQPGVLVQLLGQDVHGRVVEVVSDQQWQGRIDAGWKRDTARISIQHEAAEWRDAREDPADPDLIDHEAGWLPVTVGPFAGDGPWRDLQPARTAPLTRIAREVVALTSAAVVSQAPYTRCFDLKRLCHPDERSANFTPIAGVLTCVLTSTRTQRIRITAPQGHLVHLRGRMVADGVLHVQRGENLLSISVVSEGHHYDAAYRFDRWDGMTAGEWRWCTLLAPVAAISNVHHTTAAKLPLQAADEAKHLSSATTYRELRRRFGEREPQAAIILRDAASDFRSRAVLRALHLERPERCFHDTADSLELAPVADGAVELCLDLGVNSVGWIELDVAADAGAIIDGNLVEYVAPDGTPQYTEGCRNGFRYVCRDGWQRFVSFKRRGGRYLYLSVRATTPVRLRLARMLEATAPVAAAGPFTCSDPILERIWDISTRTLRLCMEDTYTDCPLYEQVLWIGDARNEALYNHLSFGAWEVTWNSLRLGAESLERLPIIGSQVPSGWETQIPAWSLLWIIAVQETWHATGDLARVSELYPAMLRCIEVCAEHFDRHDLFSFQAWNFFDWAPIDGNHATVLHNSLLLNGALSATRDLARVLKRPADIRRLARLQRRLLRGLHAAYDHRREAWPDAIAADGTPSASSCQHTAALGLRFGGLPDARATRAALRTLLEPSPTTVRIGSPFALQFVLEALIAHGHAADAITMLRERWGPMLAHGATTCWETFPGFEQGMLTRSHCHAWSAAPIAVLMNVVLGVTTTAPGSRTIVIRPLPGPGLTRASGSLPTPHGPVHIAWQLKAGTLHVQVASPPGVTCSVERHPQAKGIRRVVTDSVR